MKKIVAIIFAFSCLGFFAPAAHAQEVIHSFFAGYDIRPDGIVDVSELINYDFGLNERHGIYREIPLVDVQKNYIDIVVRSVTDQDGVSQPFAVEDLKSALRIKVGRADQTITGAHTYNIQYSAKYAIRSFPDADEFYWNVTGNRWTIPIESAKAEIRFPSSTPMVTITKTCYTGREGSREAECEFIAVSSTMPVLRLSSLRPLSMGEGLTLAVDFPKGLVATPSASDEQIAKRREAVQRSERFQSSAPFISIIFSFIFFGIFVLYIAMLTRKKKMRPFVPVPLRGKTVIAQYDAPDAMSPAYSGFLIDGIYNELEFIASIVELGRKGQLRVEYRVEDFPMPFIQMSYKKKDWAFIRITDGSAIDVREEKFVFDFLFGAGRDSVLLSDLSRLELPLFATRMQKHFRETVVSDGYSVPLGLRMKTLIVIDALVRQALPFLLAFFFPIFLIIYVVFGGALLGALCAVLVILYLWIVRRYNYFTPKGEEALFHLLGFREFLLSTETQRLAFINPPDLTGADFERSLGYAIVLGAEEQWAKNFSGALQGAPSWYKGPAGEKFTPALFVAQLSTIRSAFSASTSRGTSSGGSSGGGSGGGGGGSW